MQWLKRAFAIDTGPVEPTVEQQAAVERLVQAIVRRRMTAPAVMAIESLKPLNFLGSQALVALAPFVELFTDRRDHVHFSALLEHRGSVEYILGRLEAAEDDFDRRRQAEKTADSPADPDRA